MSRDRDITRGLAALRAAVAAALQPPVSPALAVAGGAPQAAPAGPSPLGWLFSEATYGPDSGVG
ncbi:hypothetical protein, partial [Nocardioides pelophilus]|uniref:hypothetical protein n=1 Tax=Nocardioides pelophilus TaxID=2172019 RepID=UPI001C81F5C3